jgi:hypothetical protein
VELSAGQRSTFGLALCLQAARDLAVPEPDVGAARAAEDVRTRIFGGSPAADPTRSIAFL